MQRFTARGINFSYQPTQMVNDWRGTQWLLPAVHPQVREPSSRIVGTRRFVSSLFSSFSFFLFPFPSFRFFSDLGEGEGDGFLRLGCC